MPTSADSKNKCVANSSPATHQTLQQQGGTGELRQLHSYCRLDSQCSGDREEEDDDDNDDDDDDDDDDDETSKQTEWLQNQHTKELIRQRSKYLTQQQRPELATPTVNQPQTETSQTGQNDVADGLGLNVLRCRADILGTKVTWLWNKPYMNEVYAVHAKSTARTKVSHQHMFDGVKNQ